MGPEAGPSPAICRAEAAASEPRGQPGRGEGRRSGEPFTQHPNSAWSSMVLSHYWLSHLSPRRAVSQYPSSRDGGRVRS